MNNDLLDAISQMLDVKLEPINSRLDGIDTKIDDLEKGQKAIRADISKVNHDLEPKINAVYEGLEGILRRNEQIDNHEKELETHDHRIFALEQTVK